jgi:hypothetical protein
MDDAISDPYSCRDSIGLFAGLPPDVRFSVYFMSRELSGSELVLILALAAG